VPCALERRTPPGHRAIEPRERRQCAQHPRLADTCLADQHENTARTGQRPLQRGVQHMDLDGAPDEVGTLNSDARFHLPSPSRVATSPA
jgi:hypothetical protein